jgi:CcmD family protein
MKKISIIASLLLFSIFSKAQTDGGDFMRNTGSIYVVVGVILIIFIGIIAFLINLDKKISKLEKEE